jgi:hypothetical protein
MNGRFRTLAVLTSRAHSTCRLALLAGLVVAFAGCAPKKEGSTPPPPTYSVSGTVSGAVTAGVTVKLQGTNRSVVTDSLGRYTMGALANGTYTVAASLAGYAFAPPTRTVAVNGASVAGQDFTAVALPPSWEIAGKVTGDGPEGVTLTLMGPDPATSTQTTTSAADGSYSFSNVSAGTYHLTPSRAGGWTFSPANALVTVAGASLSGPNFVSIAPTHALSGKVTGAVTAGVMVALFGDADALEATDGSGNYAFTALPPGNYVVTPALPGYAFTPASRSVSMGSADVTGQDFVAAATHKIAGRVSGDVLEGVKVTLSGGATGEATTDASGYYELADLRDGSYVLTPSLDGYTFTPAQRPVTLSGASVGNADFAASLATAATYTVSGSVSGAVQRGVTVTLQDGQGDPADVATTDVAGAFAFQAVSPGNYLVIPSHDDYTFAPASRFVVVGSASIAGQAFTATVKPTARTISGFVAGDVTAGVTVTLVGPSPATTTRTATTDATGYFAFRNLGDGLYLATPTLAGFAFAPANCLVSVAGPSVTSLQFASAFAPHSISGKVTGSTIAGVAVALSGAATAATVTAADGSYTFPGLANGDYLVTPALAGYYFSPVAASVMLAGANAAGVDFAIAPAHRISGHVSGAVLAGVNVSLAGASPADPVVTDGTGFYEFTDLRDGGYVLEASLDGYTFLPRPLSIDLAGADVTTADFGATLVPTFTVSGTISGAVQAGVSVRLSGAKSATTSTDAGGAYSFTGLPNGSYLVVPGASGFAFSPASRAFRVNDVDVTSQDFTSAVAP